MAHPEAPVFSEALIFLGAAVVAVPLFRRLKLGSILGYLAAGVAIGSTAVGKLWDPEEVMRIAELGVVLFLFLIGLELNLTRLWAMRRDIFGLGTAQVVLTGLLGAIFPIVVAHRSWQASLVGALGLALSSTALVMQLLEERGQVQSPHGQKAFAILLLQDLSIVPLLALVALLAPSTGEASAPVWLSLGKIVLSIGAVLLVGRFVLPPVFRSLAQWGGRESMTAAALAVVIGAATVMTYAGLSSALGAFLAGVMLAESSYRHELEADIEPFRGLLMGLFFISVGMTVDVRAILHSWPVILGAIVSLTVIKVGVVYGLVRWRAKSHETALRTALLLPQGGEFGFVLFSTAVASGVMAPAHATILVAIVTCTMALTPVLVALTPKLLPKAQAEGREESFADAHGSVLLVGFGRFGQVLSQLLLAEGLEITAIDNDVEMIEAAGRFGFRVYYGDGRRLDVLRAAGVEKAKLVCVCVETAETANAIVKGLKEVCPTTKLYVRSYDRVHALELLKLGVDYQMRETYESAVIFGRAVLEAFELDPDRIDQVEEEVRRRERERFAIQVQGGDLVPGLWASRPIPQPEPLIQPKNKSVALNPEDLPREEGKPAGGP